VLRLLGSPTRLSLTCLEESYPDRCALAHCCAAHRLVKSRIAQVRRLPSSTAEPSRPIKVLVVIPDLGIGGTETNLARNLPRLDRSRFTIVVCTLESRGALAAQLMDRGIDVVGPDLAKSTNASLLIRTFYAISHSCRYLLKKFPARLSPHLVLLGLKYLDFALALADYVRGGDFDVVHAVSPSAYVSTVIANSLSRRRPLVMSRVSLNFYHRDARFLPTIERIFHRRIDLAIGNSQAILQELRLEGIPARKLLLIYNGIDLADFTSTMLERQQARARLEISQTALVLTSVASLFPYKGHADLLNALHLAQDRLPADWILLVAGQDIDGNLATLRHLGDQLGLRQNVRFLGERQDIPAILSAADIHVSASHHEGFPNNILEAMCAGLPVVATAVGGVTEQVSEGCTGYLVPPHDPKALAAALCALVEDPSRRAAMGEEARLHVDRQFHIERNVAGLERAYASLAGLRGRRR